MAKVKKQKQKRYSARERAAFWFGAGVSSAQSNTTHYMHRCEDKKIVESYWNGRNRERVDMISSVLTERPRNKRRK